MGACLPVSKTAGWGACGSVCATMSLLGTQRRTFCLSSLVGMLLLLSSFVVAQSSQSVPNTPQQWTTAAESCSDSLCRASALQHALQLDPNFRPALHDLVDYYRGRDQREKARDILQNLIASDAHDFVARKKLADIYMEVGARQQALDGYFALESECPDEHWLKRELAAAYERAGLIDRSLRLAQAAFRETPSATVEQEQLLRLYATLHDGQALVATLKQIVALDPADTAHLVRLAEAQAVVGDFTAAEQTLRATLDRHPGDSDARRALAELLSRTDRRSESQAEFSRLLSDDRRLDDIRQRLQWSGAMISEAADPDQPYLASVDIPAALKTDAGSAKAVALADVRIERVQPSGLAATRVQQFFLIGDQQGAREFGTRTVQYSPASESLRILNAHLYKADGRVLDAEEAGDNSVADTKSAMYYDVRSRTLRYLGAEPGDIVELDYRITPETTVNAYGDYYGSLVVMQSQIPARLRRYVLVTPADRQFYVTERRVPTSSESFISEGERVRQWEMRDIPALPNEPRGLSTTEAGAYVNVSTFANWTDLGRWYAAMLRPQLQLDAPLSEVASRMRAQYPDEQERIRAIHRFVLHNTHYVALEFGIYSYKPYPVSQVYARRFGDCKDKASLMIALLRATGIDADLALVRTRRLGGFAAEAASIAPFNHAIAYLPKYDLYLDGTAEYAGARELPLEDQGAMALTVSPEGDSALRQIPVTSPADNYTRRVLRADIRRDGSIDFSGTASTRGEDAPFLRRDYEIAERQRESFRQTLAEVFPSVRVENVQVDGAHDLESDVTVNFRGVLDSYSGRNALSLSNTWIARRYVQTLAPLATRTQPLLLPAGWQTEEELHFKLPSGNASVTLPRDQRIDTQFGSAAFIYTRSDKEITIHTRVEFSRTRIQPDEYPAFRDFCRTLDFAFRQEAKVVLQ